MCTRIESHFAMPYWTGEKSLESPPPTDAADTFAVAASGIAVAISTASLKLHSQHRCAGEQTRLSWSADTRPCALDWRRA
jgi:hypothetical protein